MTSRGSTRELLLISELTSASALIGKTTVKAFGTYQEPIGRHVEPKINTTILIDITSANGLFNHFVPGSTVHIFYIDEGNSLLTKLSNPSKSAQNVNLPMERLCKCSDGDCWFILKGNKGKRSGVASTTASILAFTTPRQFLSKA